MSGREALTQSVDERIEVQAAIKGAESRWGKIKRTPLRTAAAIWKDWTTYPSVRDALRHPDMRGWKVGAAYKILGKRGAPAGPIPKKPKK